MRMAALEAQSDSEVDVGGGPAPAPQGVQEETIERLLFDIRQAMLEYGSALEAGDNAGIRVHSTNACDKLNELAALARPTPPAVQQPLAFVPVHPREGPLWSDTFDAARDARESRPRSYPLMPLYACPHAAAVSPDVQELVEAVDALLEAQDALDNREISGPNAEDYFVLLRRRNNARDGMDAALSKYGSKATGAQQ